VKKGEDSMIKRSEFLGSRIVISVGLVWPTLFGLILALTVGTVHGGSWTSTLQDGSVLEVDPSTRRPMRYYNGGTAPLWDGTHQLEDGSVVIVRDGAIVPTQGMIDTWREEPGAAPEMRGRYCEQLVRKTCGFNDECGRRQPCVLARQLLRMEREEQRRTPIGSGLYPNTASTSECLDAMGNAAFPACEGSRPDVSDTACAKLVERVCGRDDRCSSSPACDPARQLLRMETEERLESADPEARTTTGAECEKMRDNTFFKPCE
jgi:hypothetical protein